MATLIFEKKVINKKSASGTLSWGSHRFNATSGGYGNGQLPDGKYTVKTRHVVDKGLESGFKTKQAEFFIPIEATFKTTRGGLGIHPDGNKPGTLGCIGLPDADAKRFWKAWMGVSLKSRPTTLTVKTKRSTTYKLESMVSDATVKQALHKALKGDGKISYDETVAIVRSTFDGKVSRQELTDLQSLLANSKSLDTRSRRLIEVFVRNPTAVKSALATK